MATINLTLSDEDRRWIEDKAGLRGYASPEAYLEAMIARSREGERRLEEWLLEGIQSPPGPEWTPEYVEEKKRALAKRLRDGS